MPKSILSPHIAVPASFFILFLMVGVSLGGIGGDDVTLVDTSSILFGTSMDIDQNGNIYCAVSVDDFAVSGGEIKVLRSTDGGLTWEVWDRIWDPDPNNHYDHPSLIVAEGVRDQCVIAYTKAFSGSKKQIVVARSDLDLAYGDFSTEQVVMTDADWDFDPPRLACDDANYSAYYIYLVAKGYKADANSIWFARSIDRGDTFEAPYSLALTSTADEDFRHPSIAYGFGDRVHVAWTSFSLSDAFDAAIQYRRATHAGDGGLGAWDPVINLSSSSDGVWQKDACIAASSFSGTVLLAYQFGLSMYSVISGAVIVSEDFGDTFGPETTLYGGIQIPHALAQQPATGDWILAGHDSLFGIQRADQATPTVWQPFTPFEDEHHDSLYETTRDLAFDPTHADRVAVTWNFSNAGSHNQALFDAEWLGDPGYPNHENGFPVPLDHQARSGVALVDVGGDSNLEIVFSDFGDSIQVYQSDSTPLPGWPVDVGTPLTEGAPVAIGKLDGHRNYLVAGAADGRVFAYNADGTLADGWPYDIGTGQPAYVSIGAVGGPYPRCVVVTSGNSMTFLNYRGVMPPRAYGFVVGNDLVQGPAAIGDINGDGINEAVAAFGSRVYAVDMTNKYPLLDLDLGSTISAAPSLGDFDLDGDVEICVPTEADDIHLLQGDGSEFPGYWPVNTGPDYRIHRVAIGNCLGTSEPEILVSRDVGLLHLFYADGHQQAGFPISFLWDACGVPQAPVMGLIEGPSADFLQGAESKYFAVDNFGQDIPGWPEQPTPGNFCIPGYGTPAIGDLDNDGRNEVVLLGHLTLQVMDVNNPPGDPSFSWPMDGHDPQRTGCADCPEDLASPVMEGGITRVSFAVPSPNPGPGHTSFRFALPEPAAIRLEVFDLRGNRIREVLRSELAAGEHMVAWDGRDMGGRTVAAGHYYARLQVRGPGIREVQTRKITLVR